LVQLGPQFSGTIGINVCVPLTTYSATARLFPQ